MNRITSKTVLAWSLSMMIAVPLAALVGGFAGWAAGGAVGEWLEQAGLSTTLTRSDHLGGFLGATLCPLYVAYRVIRDERAMTVTLPERRETRIS